MISPIEFAAKSETAEQTRQQRYDSVSETFASFALEDMYPSTEDIRLAKEYIAGSMSLEEIRQYYLDSFSER